MSAEAPANWYPDPSERHELRYWDGVQWTEHVVSQHVQSVDPLVPFPPVVYHSQVGHEVLGRAVTAGLPNSGAPKRGRGSGKVARQLRKTKAERPTWIGGGSLLTEPILVVNQEAKLLEMNAEYRVFDQHSRQVGTVREIGQNILTKSLSFHGERRKRTLQVIDNQGYVLFQLTRPAMFLKATVIVSQGDGTPIGQIVQKFGLLGYRFDLAVGDHVIGSITGEWAQFEFRIKDAAGSEVGRISRTWAGMPKEMATKADNYVVQIHRPLEGPLLALVVTSAFAIDTALRQGDVGDADRFRTRQERWHKFGW